MTRTRGFTLVEVLVALMILSVLATLAWQGIDGILRARDGSGAVMERTLRLNTAIAQWEHDLLAVQETPAAPALDFDGGTLRLTRRTDAGVQVVAWSLRGGRWLRWTMPPVTRAGELREWWMRSRQLLGNEAGQVTVLENVGEFQLYFFRGNSWSNAQSSGDVVAPAAGAASAPPRVALPTGVRLRLQLPSGVLTRDVRLAPLPA